MSLKSYVVKLVLNLKSNSYFYREQNKNSVFDLKINITIFICFFEKK